MDLHIENWLSAEIAVVAPSGDIIHTNRKWDETAQHGNLAAGPWNYLMECDAAVARGCAEADKVARGLRAVLNGHLKAAVATYACPFAGLHHWYEAVISPMLLSGKRHALIMHVDVSELQRDAMTSLANRAFFDAQLAYILDTAAKAHQLTGVVSVDVDSLKPLNDTYGHQVGDLALKAIASELVARANAGCAGCLVCRVGGDEFAVVLPVLPVVLIVRRFLARFEPRLVASFAAPGMAAAAVTASTGTASYPADGSSVAALYKAADRAAYAVKRGSRSPARGRRTPI